jgi:hypothetical protein
MSAELRPKSSPWGERFLNAATVVVLCLTVVIAAKTFLFPSEPRTPSPLAEGDTIRELLLRTSTGEAAVSLSERTSVLYVFTTTCAVCISQKDTIARVLATLREDAVMTASSEPLATTAGYWVGARPELKPPMQLSRRAHRALRADFVPYLLVFDAGGRVVFSHLGPIALADSGRLSIALAAVGPRRSDLAEVR